MFDKWEETKGALLEGLDPAKQKIVGKVLENQKEYLAEDAASGSVQAHDISGYRKILLPMIRRIIPGSIATELVGVQPMQGPVGLVYSMRYKYMDSLNVPPGADGTANPFNPDGTHNEAGLATGDEMFANNPVLRQFYSGQDLLTETPGAPDACDPNGLYGTTTENRAGVFGIGPGGSAIDDAADALPRTPTGGASGSSIDSSNCFTSSSTFANGPYNVLGNQYGGSGSYMEGNGGRRVGLEVVSQAVEARTRKLQAGWTIEAMQDLNSQHGMDMESELTKAISAEIVQEIDAEIIADLLAIARVVDTYDFDATAGTGGEYFPTFIGDRFAGIGVLINRVANEIGRRTRRGVANFIVVSPTIVSMLQSATKSVYAPAVEGSFKGPNDTMLVGTLNGTIKVYSYLYNQTQPGTEDYILVGYKGGNGETDTGYFYCPYVPLMSSGVVINPVTFQPVVSLMTRYGKTVFDNECTSLGNSGDYYGKITVQNLAFL